MICLDLILGYSSFFWYVEFVVSIILLCCEFIIIVKVEYFIESNDGYMKFELGKLYL